MNGELAWADKLHLEAAEGWIHLGNCVYANDELNQITPELQTHPDVLEVRISVYMGMRRWEAALDTATAYTQLRPNQWLGFVIAAHALHELKRTGEAVGMLLPTVDRFPDETVIPYNLACYSCQLGELEAARKWLKRAFDVAQSADVKSMALSDRDLEPLWLDIVET